MKQLLRTLYWLVLELELWLWHGANKMKKKIMKGRKKRESNEKESDNKYKRSLRLFHRRQLPLKGLKRKTKSTRTQTILKQKNPAVNKAVKRGVILKQGITTLVTSFLYTAASVALPLVAKACLAKE